MATIVLEDICLKEKNKEIIDNFSYNFISNKVYAIVGKDNSGIDQLFDIIKGDINQSSGHIFFDGKEALAKLDPRICYIKFFRENLNVNNIFAGMASIYPHWDNYLAYSIIKDNGIPFDVRYEKLSRRNKNIVIAACTIASNAEVKVLAFPVESADLKVRNEIYEMIYKHKQKNPCTYIISTNIIDELSYAVDKILLMNDGKLIETLTMEEAKKNFFEISGKAEVVKSLIAGMRIIGYEERGSELTVCTSQKLTKDLTRKFQKFMVQTHEVKIQKLLIYLLKLREKKDYFN